MVERLELPAGARVLDVGCGRGELLARIAARWGAECVGVDLSESRRRDPSAGPGCGVSSPSPGELA
jgi:cyclopropane fatty-acyl-phospholipid synthase-like methyltransferase